MTENITAKLDGNIITQDDQHTSELTTFQSRAIAVHNTAYGLELFFYG